MAASSHSQHGTLDPEAKNPYSYFDRASKGNRGEAGVGGILYDPGSKTTSRYHWYLGRDTNNKVEAYALLKGVQLAHSKGIRNLVVLGDSLTIIRLMVKGSNPKDPSLKQILNKTRLASKGIKLSFHILREADKMANVAIGPPPDTLIIDGVSTPTTLY
jgi:ribonuclease HI